jgi:putative PEP-CTERM system histidine kinase
LSEYVLGVTVAAATGTALAVVLVSRQVRVLAKRFYARTFRKSKYDYRRQWLEVIQAFHGVGSVDAVLDGLVDVLGRTFSAPRISVWMQSDADRRFHQVRSVNVATASAPLDPSHPLIVAASASPKVIGDDDAIVVDEEFRRITRMRVVGPIWGGSLLGLVVLGDAHQSGAYDQDDFDLLHAISNHVGVLIAHAQLAASYRANAEIRALHELSMFCVHDLKNLAGRLSLVAQNAKQFGDDPEFQRSAMRTVATTGERMIALIRKLSAGTDATCTWAPDSPRTAQSAQTDLFEVLESATENLEPGIEICLPHRPEPPPKVRLSKETLNNIILNIVTNAEQALGAKGRIDIAVAERHWRWDVTIRDNGPGIEPRALARLFVPFGSTKPSGLGVGLYQCRRILEATGGSIVVESELGQGTTVTLGLPAAEIAEDAT